MVIFCTSSFLPFMRTVTAPPPEVGFDCDVGELGVQAGLSWFGLGRGVRPFC